MLTSLFDWSARYFEYVGAPGASPPAWVFVVAMLIGVVAVIFVAKSAISDMGIDSVLGVFGCYVMAVMVGSGAGMLAGLFLWLTLPAALLCMVLASIPTAIHFYRSHRRA